MIRSYPRKILKWLFIKLGLRKQKGQIRKDVEIIPFQPNLELLVYWKVLQIGKGPALILQAYGKEVLKFDCFGRDDGHFHVAPNYGERIFFDETTAKDQIERTTRELRENGQFYLNKQVEAHIRSIEINQEKMARALDPAKKKMLYFLQTITELEEIR